MQTSTVERRHGLLSAGEFAGPGRSGRGAEGRGQPAVLSIDAGTIEKVLGGAGADATGSVDAHLTFSGAGESVGVTGDWLGGSEIWEIWEIRESRAAR